ncbi:MAG: hypothetical protein V7604_306 [Hyphomicrobiales bacterium]|jgi:hypothetical protein
MENKNKIILANIQNEAQHYLMNMFSLDWLSAQSLTDPLCDKCGCKTRLAGIEPHLTRPRTDLRTFQCLACNDVQALEVPLSW